MRQPSYLALWQAGALRERVAELSKEYQNCTLCARSCGVDRTEHKGICGARADLKIASFGPHFGEESVLVGTKGSGTIFSVIVICAVFFAKTMI